jgi:hypothetical protein
MFGIGKKGSKKKPTPPEGVRAWCVDRFGDSTTLRVEEMAIKDASRDILAGKPSRLRPEDNTVYGVAYREARIELEKMLKESKDGQK